MYTLWYTNTTPESHQIFMGKSTISMVMFNSKLVSLPETPQFMSEGMWIIPYRALRGIRRSWASILTKFP